MSDDTIADSPTAVDPLDIPAGLRRSPSGNLSAGTALVKASPELKMPRDRLRAIADEVRGLHDDVAGLLQHAKPKAIRVGELLTEAKGRVARGKWIPWVQANCGFGEREAQRYLQVYRNRESSLELNATPVSYLGVKAASKAIAKPRTPTPKPSTAKASNSEARVNTALRAMHDCEPSERRRVVADPGIQESVLTVIKPVRETEPAVADPLKLAIAAFHALSPEQRTEFWRQCKDDLYAARPPELRPGPKPPKAEPPSTQPAAEAAPPL
jgi:hypothetical protein